MKTTFSNLGVEEKKVNNILDKEEQKQKSELEQKAAQRKEKQNMGTTGMNFNVIKDNFDGNMDGDNKEDDKKEEKKMILSDDFLGDLKMVDVPDSDEECYF